MSQPYGFVIELRLIIFCLPSASNNKNTLEEFSFSWQSFKTFSSFLRKYEILKSSYCGFTDASTTYSFKQPLTTNQLCPLLSSNYFLMTSAVYSA